MDRTAHNCPQDVRRALGRLGERIAAEHLQRLGFSVTARNARTRHGEIDLIAIGNEALVFVEVKTRRAPKRRQEGDRHCDLEPLAWLRFRQQQRIRRLARAWLAEHPEWRPKLRVIRFDAIGVVVDDAGRLLRLDHIEGAW